VNKNNETARPEVAIDGTGTVTLELPEGDHLGWTFIVHGPTYPGSFRAIAAAHVIAGWIMAIEYRRNPVTEKVEEHSFHLLRDPDASGELTADKVWKRLRLGQLRRTVRDDLRSRPDVVLFLPEEWNDQTLQSFPRPGGAGRSDIEYLLWADRYVKAIETNPTSPIKQMAAESGVYSESAIRAYVNKARVRGLLTTAPPGRAGGELTDKARDLLSQRDANQ
jgi:hypothetical protein